MKKIFSRQSILPDYTNHYDEKGHKIGYSRPSLLGTYTNHYNEKGQKIGRSREGLFGTVHYDENGRKIGVSHDSIFGYKNHHDTHGHKVGYNQLNPFYALRGIVINLIYSFSAGVSWQGHIGGGIAGLAAAAALCKDDHQNGWR